MSVCQHCKKPITKRARKYCSNRCQSDYEYGNYIELWKLGKVDGGRGIKTRNFSGHVRRYLLENTSACELCGWDEKNIVSGRVPLEIDHIDGNSENNQENNLRLLCPNCHAIGANYKNHNKGRGREWRRSKYLKNIS